MYSLSTILTLLAATAPIMVQAQAQHCPAHTQAVGAAIVEGAPISSATCDTKALSCSNKAPPRAVRQPGTRDQPCIYIVRFFFSFSSLHVVSEKRIVLGVVRLFADFFSSLSSRCTAVPSFRCTVRGRRGKGGRSIVRVWAVFFFAGGTRNSVQDLRVLYKEEQELPRGWWEDGWKIENGFALARG